MTLSWNGGNPQLLNQSAGSGSGFPSSGIEPNSAITPLPPDTFGKLTSTPDCRGGANNMAEILRGGRS